MIYFAGTIADWNPVRLTSPSFVYCRPTRQPQWSDDESLCARNVTNEVHFYEGRNFSTIACRLQVPGLAGFALSPGQAPYRLTIYVPATKVWKWSSISAFFFFFFSLFVITDTHLSSIYALLQQGGAAFVRMFQYPMFEGPNTCLANKSFFRSDKVNMTWNRTGKSVCAG